YIKKPAFPQVENAGKSSIFKVFSDFYDSFLTFSCTNHWKLTIMIISLITCYDSRGEVCPKLAAIAESLQISNKLIIHLTLYLQTDTFGPFGTD
ncbi:MAG: hypothetical protein SOH48_08485, partial [Eubacteriales bacterium]